MKICRIKSTYLHALNDRFEWRVNLDTVKREHAYAEVNLIHKTNMRQWLGMIPTIGLLDMKASTFTVSANSDGSPRSSAKYGQYFVETTNLKRGETIPVDLSAAEILDLMTILDEAAAITGSLYRYKVAKRLREHLYSARYKGLVDRRALDLKVEEFGRPSSPQQTALPVAND